jgi:hypothetical protein
MKYEAVIFDLFGTLVPNMSLSEHRAVLTRMADVLSALLGVPDTDDNGHGGTLSMLDLGLCDVVDMDIRVVS